MNRTKASLPVSSSESNLHEGGLRRRLSSMSLNLNLKIEGNPAAWSYSFPRSKSLSSMGDYAGTSIRKWWDWSWAWILSRKPIFAPDLEMNPHQTKLLGNPSHNKGTWRRVLYKLRSQITRFITNSDHATLPRTQA